MKQKKVVSFKKNKNNKNTMYGFCSEPYPLEEIYNLKHDNGNIQSNDKSIVQFKPGTYSKFVLPWKCHASCELSVE